MKIFIIETLVLVVLFTVICLIMCSNVDEHLNWVALNYPPEVVEYLIGEGRIDIPKTLTRKEKMKKKLPIAIFFIIILSAIVWHINGCRTFFSAFITCFGIWTIVDWYDALVLDCLWFCHSKKIRVSGTEHMDKAYKDYMFHIKGSAFGMIIGFVVSVLVGVVVVAASFL